MTSRTHSVLIWAVVLSGCSTIVPQTAALQDVHQTYRDEFGQCRVWQDDPGGIETRPDLGCSFPATRDAIADYRERHPGNTAELNHLTVLEGMIYLQGQRFGLARAMQEDVEAAGRGLTSATGVATRDQLFAESFGRMIDGWQVRVLPQSGTTAEAIAQVDELQAAADGIVGDLCRAKADGRIGQVSGDQGSTYLATMAALFMLDAEQRALSSCQTAFFPVCPDLDERCIAEQVLDIEQDGELQSCALALRPEVTAERMRRARDAVGTFLPDRERTVLVCATAPEQAAAAKVDCGSGKDWGAALADLEAEGGPSQAMAYYAYLDRRYVERRETYDRALAAPPPICPPSVP